MAGRWGRGGLGWQGWVRWVAAGAAGILGWDSWMGWEAWGGEAGDRSRIDFVTQVRPILEANCYKCHGGLQQKGGLRLDLRARALAAGDSGERAVVPGDPAGSRLVRLVRGEEGGAVMPPKGERLSGEQIALLTRWIEEGAVWPDGVDVEVRVEHKHWAFRKPQQPALPPVKESGWPRNGIDFFILARLEKEGLEPSPEADVYTLVRRLTLDLTGLPPTLEEVAGFVGDKGEGAYERLVDRLLAAPAYGERWARVWLDLARYADSKGYGSDPLRPYMWRHRDWVIEAFNRNLPYDRFTTEQLAGDLLPEPTLDQWLATAFHRNTMSNDEGGTDDEEFRVAAIKDRVDTTAQVWMGLTLACAKCHSHKFDPLSQREYYQFFALFNQTEDNDSGDDQPRHPTPTLEQQQRIARLQAQLEPLRAEQARPTPDLSAAQRRWEEEAVRADQAWTVLEPKTSRALAGTVLERQPDSSLAASGPDPATNIYHVEAETDLKGITAFRLEVFPVGEPGRTRLARSGSGNFVLGDFRVTAEWGHTQPVRGRYVRLENPGKQRILSLAEVEVIVGGENLARSGRAIQSSTGFDGPAHLAIDGNTDGNYQAKSVTHTEISDDPWWEVDLGRLVVIDRITIWNRTDNNLQSRLSDFRVRILDENRGEVRGETFAQAPNPSLAFELAGPAPVALTRPSASFAQKDFAVAQAIDADSGPRSGWAVSPETDRGQVAVFPAAQALSGEGRLTLRFTLVQAYGEQATLGRFRLSATTLHDPQPALPQAVRAALAAAPETRDAAQRELLAAHYWKISPEYAALRERMAGLENELAAVDKEIVRTPILRELAPDRRRKTHVLLKGNFLTPGEEVQPAVPGAFHPWPAGAPTNRLGLARWLMDEANPLTARVAVNRFWSVIFGKGLVESEEDFGTQGLPPSHPELLDWLALEFIRQKWDMKGLLKTVVMSSTYRQSAVATPVLQEKDPRNVLLGRSPRFRLEAEMVRDQALALSGLLSRKMFGPSVYPPQPPNLWQAAFNGERTWPVSQGEDKHRRALYTFWRRTVPYPSLLTFDAPSREYCNLRRVASSTPLQAFVTLNDPVYVEAAQALARRLVREGGATAETRAAYVLQLCLARPPQPEQVRILVDLYRSELEHFRRDTAAARQMAESQVGPVGEGMDVSELAAWTVVANVVLNLDSLLCRS